MATVDLNSDLGEGFGAWRMGDDAAMYPLVSSANLACGFHAGDASTMLAGARLALEHGVTIGAHPSYRDLAGFGRRAMDIDPHELHAEVLYQVAALRGLAATVGAEVRYLKPHGALYPRISGTGAAAEGQADAVARAAAECGLPILGLPGSAIEGIAADHGVRFIAEGFADRAYLADGTLAPRSIPGALIEDPDEVTDRALTMVLDGEVDTLDGDRIGVQIASLCVHGDTPGAVELARGIRAALEEHGVEVRAFA
ncbi:MAG: LamB/YcsF family protein [Micrococcales bacterium]|nr:LamB/YcsF family protein [Micrococcales bacterium]